MRLSKTERELLTHLTDPTQWDWGCYGKAAVKAAASLRVKVIEMPVSGVNVGPIEDALVANSRGKVVPLAPGGYGRASVQATRVEATPQDAEVIGHWLTTQSWLKGPTTLITVLNKWPEWLAKAKATMPGDIGTRQGTTPGSAGSPGQRRSEGFRRGNPDPRPNGVPQD